MRAPDPRERTWLLKPPVRPVELPTSLPPPCTPSVPRGSLRFTRRGPDAMLGKDSSALELWAVGRGPGLGGTSGAWPRRAASLSQSASCSLGLCPGLWWHPED